MPFRKMAFLFLLIYALLVSIIGMSNDSDTNKANGTNQGPQHFGFLSLKTTPTGEATFKVGETGQKLKTPFTGLPLPVGKYTIQITNDLFDMEEEVIAVVEEGKTTEIDKKLKFIKSVSQGNSSAASAGVSKVPSGTTEPRQTGASQLKSKFIKVRFNFIPSGKIKASLNGRSLDPKNPIVTAPLDTKIILIVERSGSPLVQREFFLSSEEFEKKSEVTLEVSLENNKFGYFSLTTMPPGEAVFKIDGKPWIMKTPFQNVPIPAGSYNFRVRNVDLKMEKVIRVDIQEGKTLNLTEKLEKIQ